MSRAAIIAISLLFAANAHAGSEGACSAASMINPYTLEGGISGTGAPANGGISGTGAPVAEGGVAGTGISVAKGGVSGTGSPVAQGGVAGTGISVAKGGVAGTGAPVAKGGGIGGTGDALSEYALLPQNTEGEVGIMGVVTGFASICVNGEEVQYESATPIYDNGKTAKLADLAVGKTVMLKVNSVNGVLHARAIGLFNAVSGPVKGVDIARQQINVMGQTVNVNQNIVRQLANASPNAVARVSGYRLANGNIVASRVDLVNDGANANTLGLVTGLTRDGFIVNGTKVNVTDKQTLAKVKVGSEVQVAGSWNNGTLQASHIEAQPINNVVNLVDSAIMEGYVRKDGQNHLSISGTEVSVSQGESLDNFKDKLVKIELRRNNKGQWVTDKVSERKGNRIDIDIQFKDNSKQGSDSSGKNENTSGASGSSGSSGASDTSESSSSSGNGRSGEGSSGGSGASGHDSTGSSGSGASERGSSGSSIGGSQGGGSSRPSGGGGSGGGSSHPGGGGSGGGSSSGKYK